MKSAYSYYKTKKSTIAATGLGGAVAGLIIVPAVIAAVLIVPVAAVAGGVAAGLAIVGAMGGPAVGSVICGVLGGLAASSVARYIGNAVGTAVIVAGLAVGTAAGAVVGGVTKLIGAGFENVFGIRRNKRAAQTLISAPPVSAEQNVFDVSGIRNPFEDAVKVSARNDNKTSKRPKNTFKFK